VITAIYPGTYDPVTNGHVDVIARAAAIFDRVVIGVVGNPQHKAPMFTLEERVGFLRDTVGGLENVEVDVFSELVVDFAHKWNAKVIVKGLRVISDFEWEFQMNQLNRTLAPDVETGADEEPELPLSKRTTRRYGAARLTLFDAE
jgi:pantetheine-phosphate adenylyltransferase